MDRIKITQRVRQMFNRKIFDTKNFIRFENSDKYRRLGHCDSIYQVMELEKYCLVAMATAPGLEIVTND